MQWHQLDQTQSALCSRQPTTPTPHQSIFTDWTLFLTPNQQRQSIGEEQQQTTTTTI